MQSQRRKLVLARIVKIMTLVIVFTSIFVLFSNFFRSQGVRQAFAISVEEVREQRQVAAKWGDRPVLLLWRSPSTLAALAQTEGLRDEESNTNQQPDYARNPWRSRIPEVLVVVPIGTDIGCPVEAQFNGYDLLGLRDRCRGWRYDAAGRVYGEQGALRNLRVPEYTVSEGRVTLGDSGQ